MSTSIIFLGFQVTRDFLSLYFLHINSVKYAQTIVLDEISKFSSDAPEENQKDLTSTKMSEKKINTNSRELKIDYHVRSL